MAVDFETFFGLEYPRLVRAMYLITGRGAEAEDLAQEAMTRVCARWPRVAEMESPRAYLWRTALNLSHKRRRWLEVRRRVGSDVGYPSRDPAEAVAATVDVRAALAELSREHREVLVLIDWLGLDVAEVAALLAIEPVSVRSRVHRARSHLRRLLGVHDDEPV